MMDKPFSYMIMNTHVVVDTFFCVTGLLTSYITMKSVKIDKKKLSITKYIFHRLWRLAPVYYFVLVVTLPTMLMGSGPYFKEALRLTVSNCYVYWWRNVLFINNFYPFSEVCLLQSWYVSCDLQLYLCALLVLIVLIRSQKLGLTISIFIIVVSVLYTGTMTYIYDLHPGTSLIHTDKYIIDETFVKTYASPLTHAGPYFIGVLVGYLLIMKPDIKMPKKYQVFGWISAIVCAWYTMFFNSLRTYFGYHIVEYSIHNGLCRNTWAAAVAWMIFCCTTGRGGFINSFLSWTSWIPLAKLTFLIYLIQPTLQTMYMGVFKTTHEYTHFELVIVYFGLLVMSSLLAVGCNLLIESPIMSIEKLLFRSSPEKTIIITVENEEKQINGFSIPNINSTTEINGFSNSNINPTTELCDFKETKYTYSVENKAFDEV